MKQLVRERLAPWLRFEVPAKTPTPAVTCSSKVSNDAGEFKCDGQQDTTIGTMDQLLVVMMEIRDLLQTRTHSKADDTDKSDEDEENKNDWKLAAAVFDRILFIIFSIVIVGGTIIFALIFVCVYFSY